MCKAFSSCKIVQYLSGKPGGEHCNEQRFVIFLSAVTERPTKGIKGKSRILTLDFGGIPIYWSGEGMAEMFFVWRNMYWLIHMSSIRKKN